MSRRSIVPSMVATVLLTSGLVAAAAASEPTTVPDPTHGPVGPTARFEDPVGDVTGGTGPDIVTVTISQPDASLLSFSVEFASDPPLTYDLGMMTTGALHIVIADDLDAETADWHLIVHGATLPQAVETGANMYDVAGDEVLEGVVDVTVDGPTVTLTVARALLGEPDQLAFSVAATTEGPDEAVAGQAYDVCPDDETEGVYTLTTEQA